MATPELSATYADQSTLEEVAPVGPFTATVAGWISEEGVSCLSPPLDAENLGLYDIWVQASFDGGQESRQSEHENIHFS
jgi:hypothetical protein